MRCSEILWTGILFFLLMVVCSAQGCSWERTTDSCGLTRHHTSCRFYKRASTLASQRRHDHAKEAVFLNMVPRLGETTVHSSKFAWNIIFIKCQCQAVRYVRDHPSLKPIAPCKLLGPMSMAHELCGTSSLPESPHHVEVQKERNSEVDVDMGSNSGNIWDFVNSGLCLIPSSDVFTNYSILKRNPHFQGEEFRDLSIILSLRMMI